MLKFDENKIISNDSIMKINVSELPTGVYFLNVYSKYGIEVHKFVKEGY